MKKKQLAKKWKAGEREEGEGEGEGEGVGEVVHKTDQSRSRNVAWWPIHKRITEKTNN